MKTKSEIYSKFLEKKRLFRRYKLEAKKALVTGDQFRFRVFQEESYDCKIWKEVLLWVLENDVVI